MVQQPSPNLLNLLDLLHSVLNAVTLGAVVLDQERRVVLWNDWMSKHAQIPQQQALGADFLALFPALRGSRVDAAIDQALRHHFPALLSQSLNKAPFPLYAHAQAASIDERLQQAVAVTPVDVANARRHCLIQITDVSAAVGREKLLRDQTLVLRSQTFADGLTGIANRRHFDVAMDREHRRARRHGMPLSLLMIDIDHFKAYNDHHGHQKGDQCLIQVAAALSGMLRRSADLMARYGGEEFAMILPDTDAAHATQMAETIRARAQALAIAHAPDVTGAGAGDPPRVVTVSIGVATRSTASPVDIETLIGNADRALYRAKKNGRNRVEAQLPATCA